MFLCTLSLVSYSFSLPGFKGILVYPIANTAKEQHADQAYTTIFWVGKEITAHNCLRFQVPKTQKRRTSVRRFCCVAFSLTHFDPPEQSMPTSPALTKPKPSATDSIWMNRGADKTKPVQRLVLLQERNAARHTFASLMSGANVRPELLQKIIGHADYATTANIYVHKNIGELRDAISKI